MYRMCRHAGAAGSSDPAAAGPCSSFTPMLGRFLAPGEATPELFFRPPPLFSQRTPTLPKLSMYFVFHPLAGLCRGWSGFLQGQSGKGIVQGQGSLHPCLSASHAGKLRAFPQHPLLATGRGGPWAGWMWSEPTWCHCCKPNPQLQQEGVPRCVPPAPLLSGKH